MASDEIRFTQQLFVYHRSGFKFIKVADIHNCIMLVKGRIIESALWQSTNKRHLSAFETEPNASTGTRFLAFMSFTAGLPVSSTFTATQPFRAMSRAVTRPQIMKTQHVDQPFHH